MTRGQRPYRHWVGVVFGVAAVATVIAVGFYAFAAIATVQNRPTDLEAVAASHPAVPVRVAQVERRHLTPTVEVIGTVVPDPERFSILSSATTGLVERLVVAEGARVDKGDLLIQLDERPARIAVERAEAAFARLVAKPRPEELTQARAVVAKTKAAHALAESRLKRATDLRARSPELVPDIQLLDDQSQEQAARAEWETAVAQLQLLEQGPREEVRHEAEVEIQAARLQLEYCRVTAPFAGVVVQLHARIGQRADVGTPLITILDTGEVIVQARVPGKRLKSVARAIESRRQQSPATVRCDSDSSAMFEVRGAWLDRRTEGQTSDVPVRLRVANPEGLLRVGMMVRVALHEAPIEAIAVPEAAVTVNEEGKRVVTLIRDGQAIPTAIEIFSESEPEIRVEGWVRVLSGLQAGDEVAVENGYALPEGTPVTILSASQPRASAN